MVSYYQDPKTKLIYNKLSGELAPPRFQIVNIPKKENLPSQQSSSSPSYTPPPSSPSPPSNLTWYYVKKPSGICERLNVSQNFVDRMTPRGWKFSLTDICKETPKSGCSECESCDPMKVALGTCDCGVHCGVRPPTPPDPPDPPQNCPTCPPNTIAKGSYGSILDPCRCEPPPTPPKPTCECEACKNGTGECSDKRACCNAWDVLCEMGGECSKPKPPEPTDDCGCTFLDFGCKMGCWWKKYGIIVTVVGGLIALGIILVLLRPLFSMIGAFKGGSP
jgi:hypothetical protein